jgi:hypothetical protein
METYCILSKMKQTETGLPYYDFITCIEFFASAGSSGRMRSAHNA